MHPDETERARFTLGGLLARQNRERPHQAYAIFPDGEIGFGQMHDRAIALAKGMAAMGVGRGDRVALQMPNCIDFLVVYHAIQALGAIAVPFNARFKPWELSHVFAHSDARLFFTTDLIDEHVNFVDLMFETLPELKGATPGERLRLPGAPKLEAVVLMGQTRRAPALSEADVVAEGRDVSDDVLVGLGAQVGADDIAVMLYTSGTTSAPKGCQLTHRNVLSSYDTGYAAVVGLEAGDKVWAPLPFFHCGGIGPMGSAIARGATLLSSPHFDPEVALDQIRTHRPKHLYPGFFTLLLPMLRAASYRKDDFASVKTILSVAPDKTQLMMKPLMPEGVVVMQVFGMTEGAGIVTLTRPEAPEAHRLETSGTALDGTEMRVADPATGEAIPLGSDGEIQFRGAGRFHSYFKDETATRATIIDGGWVRTGDWGRVEPDGTTFFLGRIKDMLKVGGENVAAAEIEAFLSTHPAVKLAQVIGRPDDKYGEAPVAFVELLPGQSATEAELIGFCKGRMASFKTPREVVFVTEWPMSATKIQKFKLRERLAAASA